MNSPYVPILFFLASVVELMGPCPAQTTWIVDPDNSPGTQFTDLQPAVNAASPGDVIKILWWNVNSTRRCSGAVIDKPLKIIGVSNLGAPGYPGTAIILGELEIRNIPSGSDVVLANLALGDPSAFGNPAGIYAHNVAGHLYLSQTSYYGDDNPGETCLFEDCADVVIHAGILEGPGVTIVRSQAHISLSYLHCFDVQFPPPLGPPTTSEGLVVEDSDVTLVDCTVQGADYQALPPGSYPARMGAIVRSGVLHIGPACQMWGGYFQSGIEQYGFGTTGNGQVFFDYRAATTNGWSVGTTPIFEHAPAVEHTLTVQNEPYVARVFGEHNAFTILCAGTSLRPGLPTPFGDLGLDPSSFFMIGVGMLSNTNGSLQFNFFCPNVVPIDFMFAFQTANLNPDGSIVLAPPDPFLVVREAGHL